MLPHKDGDLFNRHFANEVIFNATAITANRTNIAVFYMKGKIAATPGC